MRQPIATIAILLFSMWASAGGSEVPWPKDSEQDVEVRDLGGVWVSQHLDSPKVIYYFSLERGGVSDICPFILRVFEINPETGRVITSGGGVYCSEVVQEIIIVLYDEFGRAKKYLDIVGIIKPSDSEVLGVQFLGFTALSFDKTPEVLYKDTFFKYSH